MGYQFPITFICDYCGHHVVIQITNSLDINDGRIGLKACGWTFSGDKDYCPGCLHTNSRSAEGEPGYRPTSDVDIDLVAECNRWLNERNYQERRAERFKRRTYKGDEKSRMCVTFYRQDTGILWTHTTIYGKP